MSLLKNHKEVVQKLCNLVEEQKKCVSVIYSDEEMRREKTEILEIVQNKKNEEFILLVMGIFSSGKSTMINALIGEKLLPEGFLPETAVIGELRYSLKKKITLYPIPGRWEGGDEPFELAEPTREEIEKYVSLSSDEAINKMMANEEGEESEKRIDSPFEKMVIEWPLEILKDGVVLVDSPGTDDPWSHDYIVQGYIPRADAIIYLMDSQHAYQKGDRDKLNEINDMGKNNIVVVYTFFDKVMEDNNTPAKLEKFKKVLIGYAQKHTGLGQKAIHFVNSMGALRAKIAGDEQALKASGFAELESYLADFLVTGKGRAQVQNMASVMVVQADKAKVQAEVFNKAASEDAQELLRRVNNSRAQLESVRGSTFSTIRAFSSMLEGKLPLAKIMVQDKVNGLANDVDLEGYEPETSLPTGFGQLDPFAQNKKKKAIQDECQEELQRRMRLKLQSWMSGEMNDYVKDAISDCARNVKHDLENTSEALGEIQEAMSGNARVKTGKASDIIGGLLVGMMTGQWLIGGVSAIYGKGAAMRVVGYQLAGGFALGTAALVLGFPVTLPAVVITGIIGTIMGIAGESTAKRMAKIKQAVVDAVREEYNSDSNLAQREQTTDSVMSLIGKVFDGAVNDLRDAVNNEIREAENSIQESIKISSRSAAEKEQMIEARKQAVVKLDAIQAETAAICAGYGIKREDVGL